MGYKDSRAFLLLLVSFVLIYTGCRTSEADRPARRAMYYWKTRLNLNNYDKAFLREHQVEHLWVRCFDVDWDSQQQRPMPIGVLQMDESLSIDQPIVPVVFITNRCIRALADSQVSSLAHQIDGLLSHLKSAHPSITWQPEWQIDCDWTTQTKQRYFTLLDSLHALRPNDTLTATIRLHQVRQMSKTGVPPVDRGMLMVYNMGDLQQVGDHNSILDEQTLAPYLSALQQYPLTLDMALPVFSWMLQFRGQAFVGILRETPASLMENNPAFRALSAHRWEALKDTTLAGYPVQAGDQFRWEDAPMETLQSVAKALRAHRKNTPKWVGLYHLDSIPLSKYASHDLETVFRGLH